MSRALPLLLFAAIMALPLLPVPNYWITLGNYVGIAGIIGIGLVVLTGFGGMTSFAQATFMGFGAYATAILSTRYGLSPWLTLPVSLASAGLLALAIGAVTLRLSGHYLALGTLAWAVSFYYVFANLDLLGRNDGISGIPPLRLFGVALVDSRAYFYPVWIGVALCILLTLNLLDSRAGRAIRALRGGTRAAASFGVNLTSTRMLAFTYAAVLAGFAGWLYAHMQRSVNPTPFGLNASIEYLLMVVIGGAGSVWGALLGAGLVTVVNDKLQDILPRLLGSAGSYETIVFGALLVAALQAAPDGLDLVIGWRDGAAEADWHVRLRPERSGYEREKAVHWWRGLGGGRDAPMTAAGFLERAACLTRPAAIRIRPGRLSEQIECRARDGRILGAVRRQPGYDA